MLSRSSVSMRGVVCGLRALVLRRSARARPAGVWPRCFFACIPRQRRWQLLCCRPSPHGRPAPPPGHDGASRAGPSAPPGAAAPAPWGPQGAAREAFFAGASATRHRPPRPLPRSSARHDARGAAPLAPPLRRPPSRAPGRARTTPSSATQHTLTSGSFLFPPAPPPLGSERQLQAAGYVALGASPGCRGARGPRCSQQCPAVANKRICVFIIRKFFRKMAVQIGPALASLASSTRVLTAPASHGQG